MLGLRLGLRLGWLFVDDGVFAGGAEQECSGYGRGYGWGGWLWMTGCLRVGPRRNARATAGATVGVVVCG